MTKKKIWGVEANDMDFEPQPVIVEKEDCSTNVLALGFLALILAFAIGLVVMGRKPATANQPEPDPVEVLTTQVEELTLRVEKAEEGIKQVDTKCHVLGGLVNNNFHVIKWNKKADDMVFVSENWLLSKFPPHLEVKDKEEYKEKFVE